MAVSPLTWTHPRRDDLRREDGVRLALDRWGETPAQVLFAHGFGQTRGAWSATARQLQAAGYSSLTLDSRGHGDSDWNPHGQSYSIQQLGHDLAACARREPSRPVLVGASMGGLLGLGVQAREALFSALILVDIAPRWDSAGVERILGFMAAHPEGFADLQQAADAIAGYLPHRPRKSDEALQAVLRRSDDGRWRWHWDPRLLDDVGRAGQEHQAMLDAAARSIRVPVLLISGGRSDLLGAAHIEHFLELVPHAQHAQIADATHMVAGDQNDQFSASILAFLHQLGRPARAVAGVSP